jgi:hypothetical protein
MNADRMANTPAKKSLKKKALGTVIINLQQTPLDSKCAVRIWAKLDDAFKILLQKLNITLVPKVTTIPEGDVYKVPYNAEGKKVSDNIDSYSYKYKDLHSLMTLDLRPNSNIQIIAEGAMNYGCKGTISDEKKDGHYTVKVAEKLFPVYRMFGSWFVDAALRGALPQLPFINENPTVIKLERPYVYQGITQNEKPLETSLGTLTLEEKKEEKVEDILPSTVNILQSHYPVPSASDNVHKWGLSLEPGAEKVVQQVEYILHPTFSERHITCNAAPFSFERIGWGTFTVDVALTLKTGKKIQAKHPLTFDDDGAKVSVTSITV